MKRIVLCFLVSVVLLHAEIIPASRRTTWTPGTTVGVHGGIPVRTLEDAYADQTIDSGTYAAPDYSDPASVLDATAHFRAKIEACVEHGVVYIPAGHYKLSELDFADIADVKNVTIRGAGKGVTTLHFDISRGAYGFKFEPTGYGSGTTGDDERDNYGSTAITSVSGDRTQIQVAALTTEAMDSPGTFATMTENRFVRVRNTGLTYVAIFADPSIDPQIFSSVHLITAINEGTKTLTISPPLPNDVTGAEATPFAQGNFEGIGFEDLSIDCGAPNGGGAIAQPFEFYHMVNWWWKNIEISGHRRIANIIQSIFGEIRGGYFHTNATFTGPSSEAISLARDACFILIEDNAAVRGGSPWLTIGEAGGSVQASGCAGNVVAYNFAVGGQAFDEPNSPIYANHGSHPNYCLFEGNITEQLESDGWHTTASQLTLHRNWCFGIWPGPNQWKAGMRMSRGTTYSNVTGNVLLDASWTAGQYRSNIFWGGYSGQTSGTIGPDTPPNYRSFPVSPPADSRTDYNAYPMEAAGEWGATAVGTSIYHGNFDYSKNSGSGEQQWSSDIADHALPDSYYTTKAELVARGVVWGNLPFPPVNPASPPGSYSEAKAATLLPAAYRYVNGTNPPTGGRVWNLNRLNAGALRRR